MGRNRLEAFSDGVLAIIITIMVLEMRPPHGVELSSLAPLLPVFLSYVLSYTYVGIYWNNHHHMLHTVQRVSGRVLLANLHLLFWLSLFPFATGWMGQNRFAPLPTTLYGAVLLMASLAYSLLQALIIADQGEGSALRQAIGSDWKGKTSVVCYTAAIVASFFVPWLSQALFIFVALLWLVPDRRIERFMSSREP